MKLTEKQNELFEFVTKMHGEQKRKYTGEPYVNHCLQVAELVSEFEGDCIEIALCHDLFEDTKCDFKMLYNELIRLEYERKEAYDICTNVTELSDKFTHEDYPYLNRKQRKINEAERLGKISFKSQSVKYADLINNTESIVANDKGFAKVYLSEKDLILQLMNKGNAVLFCNCLKSLQNATHELNCL
jgi:(p)ppGpp synthase/HD superfamily hydrolase